MNVVIVGAGLAGLTCARLLDRDQRKVFQIQLQDAQQRRNVHTLRRDGADSTVTRGGLAQPLYFAADTKQYGRHRMRSF